MKTFAFQLRIIDVEAAIRDAGYCFAEDACCYGRLERCMCLGTYSRNIAIAYDWASKLKEVEANKQKDERFGVVERAIDLAKARKKLRRKYPARIFRIEHCNER